MRRILCVAILVLATASLQAGTITLVPGSQTVVGSGQTQVAISVPPEIVSAYQVELLFNPLIVVPTAVFFGVQLGGALVSL